ncbi:MAG: hypothetical protein EXR72_15450 [Myxococcales bacterium]|nr:hypothetical protein [Myxococcales bacterium]
MEANNVGLSIAIYVHGEIHLAITVEIICDQPAGEEADNIGLDGMEHGLHALPLPAGAARTVPRRLAAFSNGCRSFLTTAILAVFQENSCARS